MTKRYMTIREVAKIFFSGKISASSIYRGIENGEIPAIRIGRKYLIDVETLNAKFSQ